MKRLYKDVTVEPSGSDFEIALDGRRIKTPGRVALSVPSEPLASLVAKEWQDQGDTVKPASMIYTRLANSAIDRVAPRMEAVVDEVAAFGASDALCYRAAEPDDLVERQNATWDPYLAWAKSHWSIEMLTTNGIMPVKQHASSLAALKAEVAAVGAFELTALHALTGGFGSLILALAYVHQHAPLETLWAASQLDELYQVEQWGEDQEATDNRSLLHGELKVAARFYESLRA